MDKPSHWQIMGVAEMGVAEMHGSSGRWAAGSTGKYVACAPAFLLPSLLQLLMLASCFVCGGCLLVPPEQAH